ELRWDDVPRTWGDRWVETSNRYVSQSADDVRDAVLMIESCAARFAAVHPAAAANEEVVAHQAEMLVRALIKSPVAGRLFSLQLWTKISRHHRRTALRAFPRFATVFLFGQLPIRVRRALRR